MPAGGALTRGEIDGYTEFVKNYGAKGLAWIKVNDASQLNESGLQSPIVKNLSEPALKAALERSGARNGDLLFFGADKAKVVNDALGALRVKLGHERGHAESGWKPLWVLDFPMFEWDEEEKRWNAMHHPFTAPADGHENLLQSDPAAARAKAHDMVLNGWEIGGGSVRIHRREVQAEGLRGARHRTGRGAGQVRLSPRRPAVRRAAARRDRVRPRPHRGAHGRGGFDKGRDRVSQDAAGAVPAHEGAERGGRAAAARAAYPAAATGAVELNRQGPE